ncbi:MAG TPA: hypothetical protein VHF22_14925, partial [Planctomycetota bacterium]|nr:hypothetical protein [Planctomycetota bacterium]
AGTPVVVVFSPINDPARWRPLGPRVEVVLPPPGRPVAAVDASAVLAALGRVLGQTGGGAGGG